MFKDFTKLYNLVDLRSVIILIRKIQSFYIESATKLCKSDLESKNPIKIKYAKDFINNYWKTNMQDIFEGLQNSGYCVELEENKININRI